MYTCTAPWVRTGEYNDGHVVLKKMVFDCFLLINTPLLPFTLVVYSACQVSNPQPFNGRYISYADVTLCHVLVQTAIIRG